MIFNFILILQTLTSQAVAEYRAYELIIKDAAGSSKTITSTLDDMQYTTYYPLHLGETIYLNDHWMCYGRTHDKPFCPKPLREPASVPSPVPNAPPSPGGEALD